MRLLSYHLTTLKFGHPVNTTKNATNHEGPNPHSRSKLHAINRAKGAPFCKSHQWVFPMRQVRTTRFLRSRTNRYPNRMNHHATICSVEDLRLRHLLAFWSPVLLKQRRDNWPSALLIACWEVRCKTTSDNKSVWRRQTLRKRDKGTPLCLRLFFTFGEISFVYIKLCEI